MSPSRRLRLAFVLPLAVSAMLVAPHAASAQLGAIEAFARRVTDLSFNAGVGGLRGGNDGVRADDFGIRSYGLELLFEVGTIVETLGPAPAVQDTAQLSWTEMVVVVGENGVDTTYVYEVSEPPAPSAPTRPIWTFEMGIGYGQIVGFESSDPDLDLRGQVRELPSATLYANYEPLGFYIGLKSGFMTLRGLRAYDTSGTAFSGTADTFLLGGLVGKSVEVLGLNLLAEAGYAVRTFPSVEWRGVLTNTPLPLNLPREISVTGWSVGLGLQFVIGN